MHSHTLAFVTPVTGARFNAPWGPTSRTTPIKPCRVRRFVTLDRCRFEYWRRTGEIWRHKRPPIMGGAGGDVVLFTVTGTYTAPSIAVDGYDVIQALISCWGGGGGGGARSGIAGVTPGAGGGAGAFAQSAYTLTPATVYTVTVATNSVAGANGTPTWFDSTSGIYARFGTAGVNNTPGVGGTVALSVGTTRYAGGDGGAGSGVTGGGGGGGAGTTGEGGDASGTTPGTGTSVEGGDGGASNGGGSLFGGAGGGAAAATGTAGIGRQGQVKVDPTRFRVQNNVVTEHVALLTRNISAARSFGIITEHALARTLKVAITHPVITEHVVTQGAKSIVKTAFPVITEHVTALTRRLVAARSFSTITEHVAALTRRLVLSRTFPLVTEHVTALTRRAVLTRSFPLVTEHVTALTRRLVASRTFAVRTEHVTALTRRLVASRLFPVVTEHVTALTRRLVLTRTFPVITEHELSQSKILTFDRKFFVITEHVVTAQVCMDFDDVPTSEGGGGTTVIKPIFVFDDF